MKDNLRESKSHGTAGYAYSHYTISRVGHGFQVPVHWHEELELIYVRSGTLRVNTGGRDFEVSGGQVVIVNPRQLHMMGSPDGSVTYHTLLFPLELISFQCADELEQTIFRPLRSGQRVLENRVPEEVLTPEHLALLDRVVQINNGKTPMYQLETRLLLLRFLMEVMLRCPPRRADADEVGKLRKEMLEYIRIHYNRKLTLPDLAEQFHLSPKYLSRYFKKHFHLTFSEYLGHLRMEQARELLENTDLSVTEIAARCGFSGISFFIRKFTQVNGCPPLQWRRRSRTAEVPASPGKETAS